MNIGANAFWAKEYRRQIAKMIGICYRYVSVRETAEDLAHDAFLKAIEKADTFQGIGSFDKWLMRITVNTALKYLRDNSQTTHDQDIDNLEEVVDEHEEDLSPEDMMSAIRKADFKQEDILDAISQLPEHHRVVLNLYVFEHLSHKEIAKLLDISPNTSKSHLMRARKELQIILFNKSKREKRTLMVLFPLFFGPEFAIDGYCRQQLRGFAIAPQHPLGVTDFPSAASQPLTPRMKLHAWRAPLAVGATTVTVSALMVPFLISPKETTTPALPTPSPAPVVIDSVNQELTDYQEEEITQPSSPKAVSHPVHHKQTVEPVAPAISQTEVDTSSQAPNNVVVRKVKRRRHQTIVIEDNQNNNNE